MPALAVTELLHERATASARCPTRAGDDEGAIGLVSRPATRSTARLVVGSQPASSASSVVPSSRRTWRPSSRPSARTVVSTTLSAYTSPLAGRRRPASGLVYADNVVLTTVRALGREDGLHVRRGDGTTLDAELAGWDPTTSLAVLRVAGLDTKPIAPSSSPARVGHLALAVARSWSNSVTASAGIVSVIGGPLQTGYRRAIDQVIRTTAPMHDGFAGGAFLDTSGALIGVATASAIRGLGVVIPASIAWKTAATVLEHGGLKRGYLGIAGQPVTLPENQKGADGRDEALLVVGVTAGSPAAS